MTGASLPPAEPKSTPETISELKDLLVDYAKQETIVPLKGLGRYLGLGIPGAILVSLGLVFLALSGLRAMQSETTVFDGRWSWAPYLIVLVGLALVIAISIAAIKRGRSTS
jgi:hypothetical protein